MGAQVRRLPPARGEEWEAVLGRLASHPEAASADRPPLPVTLDLPTAFSSQPRRHREPAFLAAKQARLFEPHVAPINTLVERIRVETGGHVPYVDPDSGGIAARVLFVLESPAGPAALGSTMLSADNDDGTANNVWLAYQSSQMPRSMGLHWNAVPWYVGNGKKEANVTAADVEKGRRYLLQLLDLAAGIRVVVPLGRRAQRSVAGAAIELARRQIRVISAPHPSPRVAAVTRGQSLREINDAFAEALRRIDPNGGWPHET